MASYAVSYDIHYDNTYSSRYQSLMAAIHKAPGKTIWEETTSFALVETTETLITFANRLFLSDFAPSKDKLLVIDHATSSAVSYGNIEYPNTLKSHFKYFS